MGNSLACCGKSGGDPNDISLDDLSRFKGDKIKCIIKIQSLYRGYSARKRVQQLRYGLTGGGIMPGQLQGPPNYDNPEV